MVRTACLSCPLCSHDGAPLALYLRLFCLAVGGYIHVANDTRCTLVVVFVAHERGVLEPRHRSRHWNLDGRQGTYRLMGRTSPTRLGNVGWRRAWKRRWHPTH